MVNGSESFPSGDDALEIALLVDKICDQFESSWKAGSRPSLESFLSEVDVSTRPTLLTELIQVDICYRRQLGESPRLEEYLSRFPDVSLAIASIDADSNGELEPTVESPRKLAQYQLIQIIGSGSFGKVWKAWDETVRRFVAIKDDLMALRVTCGMKLPTASSHPCVGLWIKPVRKLASHSQSCKSDVPPDW